MSPCRGCLLVRIRPDGHLVKSPSVKQTAPDKVSDIGLVAPGRRVSFETESTLAYYFILWCFPTCKYILLRISYF